MKLFPADRSQRAVPRTQVAVKTHPLTASVTMLYARKSTAQAAADIRLQSDLRPGSIAPIAAPKPRLAATAAMR
jgi:hypothetical protein